jgi:hypothetical protein
VHTTRESLLFFGRTPGADALAGMQKMTGCRPKHFRARPRKRLAEKKICPGKCVHVYFV